MFSVNTWEIISCRFLQGAAKNPNAADQQQKLKQAAEDLRSATNAAASDALKKKLVRRLEVCIHDHEFETLSVPRRKIPAGDSSKTCTLEMHAWLPNHYPLFRHLLSTSITNEGTQQNKIWFGFFFNQVASKEAAGQATQLIAAAQMAGPSNRNQTSQQQLDDQCKVRMQMQSQFALKVMFCHKCPKFGGFLII